MSERADLRQCPIEGLRRDWLSVDGVVPCQRVRSRRLGVTLPDRRCLLGRWNTATKFPSTARLPSVGLPVRTCLDSRGRRRVNRRHHRYEIASWTRRNRHVRPRRPQPADQCSQRAGPYRSDSSQHTRCVTALVTVGKWSGSANRAISDGLTGWGTGDSAFRVRSCLLEL